MYKKKTRIAAMLLAGLLAGQVSNQWVLPSAFQIPSTMLKVSAAEEENKEVQMDVPDFRDTLVEAFGQDSIAGCAATYSEMNDRRIMELMTKHFNAVTFGNELKPDCLFGYSNGKCPGTEIIEFNGKSMVVPKADFGRADSMIQKIKEWNDANPDKKLRVRGHVLLWHSQTPEWFFHEDYDKTKDYVDKETMNQRLEWYISMVFEHFFHEDSPYKDMFYGWDVVNEATTDGGDVYRTDVENSSDKLTDDTHGSKSSWWHVYESNEFIINAFKYANKYAPESLELYYNDYGETSPQKRERIKTLLTAVKEAEGAPGEGTRIDGFGMQGHYDMNNFSLADFETAAREYAKIVGAVQLTELDFKASNSYDGSEDSRQAEYVAQAGNYKAIFDTYKKLQAEGIKIKGITFWGTVDKYSWLQSQSNVGGGADGKRSQCPLLFDDNYQVKPAYWAFVDTTQIQSPIQKLQFVKNVEGSLVRAPKFTFSKAGIEVTVESIWCDEGIKLQYTVTDRTMDDEDGITFYVDEKNERKDGITPIKVEKTRKDSSTAPGGYKGKIDIPLTDPHVGSVLGFDFVVTNNGQKVSFNDMQNSQETSSLSYAKLTLASAITEFSKGTVMVDGQAEELWDSARVLPLWKYENTKADASVKILWDLENLYILANVQDANIDTSAEDDLQKDGLEIFLDEKNEKASSFDRNDKLFWIHADGTVAGQGQRAKEKQVNAKVVTTETGYTIEAAIAWDLLTPKVHGLVGFDLKIKDAENGALTGGLGFCNISEDGYENPSVFGVLKCEDALKDDNAEGAKDKVLIENPYGTLPSEETDAQIPSETDQVNPEQTEKKGLPIGWICIFGGCGIIAGSIATSFRKKNKKKNEKKNEK